MKDSLKRKDIFSFADIHSHVPGPDRVLSVDFTQSQRLPTDEQAFTLGVHPWNADRQVNWDEFEKHLDNPLLVGIGEAGLDSLRGPELEKQLDVFRRQIEIAEKHSLPLIIHSVRNNHRILELKKKYNPSVPWIIHGFRGSPAQAQQLLDAGLHLSIGRQYDPRLEPLLGHPSIHRESDEECEQ